MISHADTEPERRLWSAVITRAASDLYSVNKPRQQSAASFFASPAFELVGNAAGLEPDEITQLQGLASAGLLRFRYQHQHHGHVERSGSVEAEPYRL